MLIVSKTVMKKWSKRNMKYFTSKGYTYTKINDLFEVDIKDLKDSDRMWVDIECDICGKKAKGRFSYCRNQEIITCGNYQCVQAKRELTVNKRYGTNNVFQVESVKDKIKNTNLERYGQEYYTQTEEYKNKCEATCTEKYGVRSALCKDAIGYQKMKNTFKDKYGTENLMSLSEFKEKRKKTWEQKYGCSNPQNCESVRNKTKQTNMEKFGYENPFLSPEIQEKIKQTNLEKYGCECPMRNTIIRGKTIKTMRKNASKIVASEDQKRLCKLLNGELNYKEVIDKRRFYLDIAFPNEKTYIEVDSPGHFAYMKINKLNENQGYFKDKKRDELIHQLGYTNIRLISRYKNLTDMYKDDFNKFFIVLINKLKNLLKNNKRVLCDFDNNIVVIEPEMKKINLKDLME